MSNQDPASVFEDADKQFDLVFSAVKTGRSSAASYNLQGDVQCVYRSTTLSDQLFISI